MAGGGSSESHSTDMTPQAFQGLQGPYAAVIGNMLGFQLRNQNGLVNPVNFGYPAGQTAIGSGTPGGGGGGGGGFGGGSGGGAGGNQPQYLYSERIPGGGSTGGNYGIPNPNYNGGNGRGGYGGGAGGPLAGMYLSNPNLGTGNPNDILNGIPTYNGPLTAGMTGSEGMQLGQLNQNQYGLGGMTNNLADMYLGGQMAGQYLPGPSAPIGQFAQNYSAAQPQFNNTTMNPFLNAAITAAQTPTMQNLQETLGQGLPSQFAMAGQHTQPGGSSAFDRAGNIAIRGAQQEMGNIASTMSNQFYGQQQAQQAAFEQQNAGATNAAMQQELGQEFQGGQNAQNRQLTAAQTAPAVTSTQVSNMVQNLQAQALPRLIQQYGIENGMQQFNDRVNSLLGVLGIAGGVTKPTVGQSSSSEQKPNLLPLAGL